MTEYLKSGQAPAIVYGEPSERAFLFVHGLCGNKEEGERFAALVNPKGWQVLAVDLPEHNGRQDGVRLVPWEAVPELEKSVIMPKVADRGSGRGPSAWARG